MKIDNKINIHTEEYFDRDSVVQTHMLSTTAH